MTYLNDIDLPDPPWIGNPDYDRARYEAESEEEYSEDEDDDI